MPRRSKGPVYYASKHARFANIKGEAVKLIEGPKKATAKDAQDRYDKLAQTRSAEVEGDKAETWAVLNAYLNDARTRVAPPPLSPNTYRLHHKAIEDFCGFEFEPGKSCGKVRVRDLKMEHIQKWVTARKEGGIYGNKKVGMKWSDTYAHLQMRILRTAFLWAVNEGELISESIFARRGKKRVRLGTPDLSLKRLALNDGEFAALLAQAERRKNGQFAELLRLLYATGSRPAEMYLTWAEEWNRERQAIVIDPSDPRNIGRLKNRRHLRKKGRQRVIRVPDALVPLMEQLVSTYPTGPLFHMEDGRPWEATKDPAKAISMRFKTLVTAVNRAAAKQGKPQPVRPAVSFYSFRHAYVTRFLRGGGKVMVLCELLNTSLEMLQAHYSHLLDEHDELLQAVNQFATPSEAPPRPQTSASCGEQPAA
jgi:integrase